jgi:hypothetical protein
MQGDDLPPLPRYPPGLLSWRTAQVIALNALAIGLNLYTAHMNARDGRDVFMFLSCCAVAMSLWAFSVFARRTRHELKEWAELRRMHAELAKQRGSKNGNDRNG